MLNSKNKKRAEAVREGDYVYASALVRTRAYSRINYDALLRVAQARDVDEICKILPEYSIEPIFSASGELDTEKTVNSYISNELETVSKVISQKAIVDFIKIPYDCHNLKSVAKCAFRDRGDCEDLLIDMGRVPAKDVLSYVKSENLSAFSKNLALSYEKAKTAFAESGDPKLIDSILDTACYADMIEATSSYKNKYFQRLVEIKIDTTNLMTAVRTIRMGDTTGLFDSMFIGGSSLNLAFFKKAMENGEDSLFDALNKKGYNIRTDDGKISLTQLGKECEDIYMKAVDSAKDISFGAEVCVSYLIKTIHAIKILRMVIASKISGIESSKIKEKIGKF